MKHLKKKTLFQKILIILISWCDCYVSDLKLSVALRYWVGNKEWSGMNCIVLKALAYRAFLCTYADRSGFQMSCGQLSIARPEAPSSLSSMEWCIKFLQRPSVFIVYSNDNLKLSGCQIIWWMLTTLPRFSVSRSVITVFL